MSVRVSSWVWHHSQVRSSTELLVLLGIADSCEDDGTRAWPSVPYLARKTRLTPRTVQRAIRSLEQQSLLVVHDQAGGPAELPARHRPNRFDIVMRGDNVTPQPESGVTSTVVRGDKSAWSGASHVTPKTSFRRPETSARRAGGRSDGAAAGGEGVPCGQEAV